MKRILLMNLVVVIGVGVTLSALLGVVFCVVEVNDMQRQADRIQAKSRELTAAAGKAESPAWIAQMNEVLKQITAQQEEVIGRALRFGNRQQLRVVSREPAAPKAIPFPVPDESALWTFRPAYRKSFEEWLEKMGAIAALTADEVRQKVEEEKKRISAGRTGRMAAADSAKIERETREREVLKRALSGMIYADLSRFDIFEAPAGSVAAWPVTDMWTAQLNWWIQRDLVYAIIAANSEPVGGAAGGGLKPRNVLDAPVKELVSVSVGKGYYSGPGAADTAQQRVMTEHVTCPQYDVVHYSFRVVMSVQDVPLLIGKLCIQDFHTVLSLGFETMDRKPGVETGEYLYGAEPVMLVTFNCECLFMKSPLSWRDPAKRDEARRKRSEFLRKYPDMVLKVVRDGREVALPAEPREREKAVRDLLNQPGDALIVAFYEDLIPRAVKENLPGFAPETAARPVR